MCSQNFVLESKPNENNGQRRNFRGLQNFSLSFARQFVRTVNGRILRGGGLPDDSTFGDCGNMISMNEALALEKAEFEFRKIRRKEEKLTDVSFNPLRLKYETESFWVFAAASPELQEKGIVPGAVHFTIDKKDGHLWQGSEVENYYLRKQKVLEKQAA